MSEDVKKEESGTREFTENPFDHQDIRPEDIVRLFYVHDVPIIPVISKRGILIGILKKQSIISELSDIERVEKLKIDEFVTRNAAKMNFDDLIPYGKIREFIVINIFGEIQGKWSRIQLFSACESVKDSSHESEVKKQQEEQALEWMIYLILEHIPRALYAINEKGRTIFYNSHFEELYYKKYMTEVNVEMMEKLLNDPFKNELHSNSDKDDILFHNSELNIFYERIPLKSKDKKSGFLIFCEKDASGESAGAEELKLPGVNLKDKSLQEIMDDVERHLIVDAIRRNKTLDESAAALHLSRHGLNAKIKKFAIEINNN